MKGAREQMLKKHMRVWIAPKPTTFNIDIIPYPHLLEELIELKEQKNEHTKEAT